MHEHTALKPDKCLYRLKSDAKLIRKEADSMLKEIEIEFNNLTDEHGDTLRKTLKQDLDNFRGMLRKDRFVAYLHIFTYKTRTASVISSYKAKHFRSVFWAKIDEIILKMFLIMSLIFTAYFMLTMLTNLGYHIFRFWNFIVDLFTMLIPLVILLITFLSYFY